MRRVVGYIFILAGLGLASFVLPIGSERRQDVGSADAGRESQKEWSVEITAADPQSPARADSRWGVEPQPPTKPAAPSPPVVITIHQSAEFARVPQSSAAPIPSDRAMLVRELQRELTRVSCYSGALNGVWTTSTREAMKSFTDRVNARLPVENPDAILLSLLRSHQGQACGSCPTGQSLAKDGRCLPIAILADAAKKNAPSPEKPAPAISGWTTTTMAVAPTLLEALPADRMALAGPQIEAPPAASETPPVPASKSRYARRERTYERRGTARRSRFVASIFNSRNSPY
jgi:hypothetical protein